MTTMGPSAHRPKQPVRMTLTSFSRPVARISFSKAAAIYLQKNGLTERFSRFDALLILPDGTIEYIEQAFEYIES